MMCFSRIIKEYMIAIERTPLLKATVLDEDFKLLVEQYGAGIFRTATKAAKVHQITGMEGLVTQGCDGNLNE